MGRFPPAVLRSSSSLKTSSGMDFTRRDVTINNELGHVYVPSGVKSYMETRLVIACHGVASKPSFMEASQFTPNLDAFIERGWVVASHTAGGNAWGNERAMQGNAATYDYVAREWFINKVLVMGFSMGGLTTLNITGRKVVPRVVGAITVNGVVDTHTFDQGVWSHYGASSWNDMIVKQAGYDPMRDDPQRWAGLPVLQIAGSGDSTCHPSEHAEPFAARAATPELIQTHIGPWGHLNGPFAPEVATAFADTLMEPFDANQVPPMDDPLPGWPDETAPEPEPEPEPGAPPPLGSGAWRTDGTPATLSLTNGSVVQLSRP